MLFAGEECKMFRRTSMEFKLPHCVGEAGNHGDTMGNLRWDTLMHRARRFFVITHPWCVGDEGGNNTAPREARRKNEKNKVLMAWESRGGQVN